LPSKAAGRRRGFDNYRTKHLGELEGMKRAGIVQEKDAPRKSAASLHRCRPSPAHEVRHHNWRDRAGIRRAELTREADTALEREILMPRLLFAAYRVLRMADERQKPDAQRDPDYQERNVPQLATS